MNFKIKEEAIMSSETVAVAPSAGMRAGIRMLLALTGPVLLTQYASIALGVADTVMASRLGTESLAGVALGTGVWFPVQAFLIGLMYSVLIAMSHLTGAQKFKEIFSTLQQGIWLALVVGGAFACGIYWLSYNMASFGFSTSLAEVSGSYLRGVAWGIPFYSVFFALRFFCEGQKIVRPVTCIALIMVLTNVFLNWVFMFGKLGFPAFGAFGCGLATSVCMLLSMVLLLGFVIRSSRFKEMHSFFVFSPPAKSMLKLAGVGTAVGINFLSEYLVMAFIMVMAGNIGSIAAAGHQVAVNFCMVLLTTSVSLSIATSICSGNLRGTGDRQLEQQTVFAAIVLSLGAGLCMALLMGISFSRTAALYTTDPAVREQAVAIAKVAVLFLAANSLQLCLAGALRGIRDVGYVMAVNSGTQWLFGMPFGYVLAGTSLPSWLPFVSPELGIIGWWVGFTCGTLLATLLLALRARARFFRT